MKFKKLLSSIAFAVLALHGANAHAAYTLDLKIDEAYLTDSGAATELAAVKSITGDNNLVQDFALDFNLAEALLNPGTTDQWVLDVAPDTPGYFLLKFGTGSTNATANTFFFQHLGELNKLVWSNADVQFLSGGNCKDGNDNGCNIGRLSHYSAFGTGLGDNANTSVPEPGTVILLGLGLLGFGVSRQRS